eukprot:g29095.t1
METIFAKGGVGHQMYFVEGRWLLYSTDTGLKNWLKISGMENEIHTRSSPTRRLNNILRGRRHIIQEEILEAYELAYGTYLCEATLWVDKWHHYGDFVSTGHSKLVIVNSDAFAEDSLRMVSHYARRYVEMLKSFSDAGQALGDVVESDLYLLLGVEKPERPASPFLRGNSGGSFISGSFMTDRGRSGSSLGLDNSSLVAETVKPTGLIAQGRLDTIQSEGEFKELTEGARVGGLFTAKLQRSEPDTVLDTTLQATDEGDQELSPVSLVSPEAGQSPRDDLALRFDECLDQLVEVLWSFYLRLQLVHEDQRALWHDLDRCRQRRRLYPYDTAWTLHEQNVSEKLRSLANYKEQLLGHEDRLVQQQQQNQRDFYDLERQLLGLQDQLPSVPSTPVSVPRHRAPPLARADAPPTAPDSPPRAPPPLPTAKPAESLESPAERRMLAALEEHGLEEVEMVGDGNCQFRALAHQWFGSEEHHASLRTAVVQQLKDWPERYKVWETAEFDYEFWVDRSLEPSEKTTTRVLRLVFRSRREEQRQLLTEQEQSLQCRLHAGDQETCTFVAQDEKICDRLQHSLATRLARLADERRLLEAQRRLQGDLRDLGRQATDLMDWATDLVDWAGGSGWCVVMEIANFEPWHGKG